MADEAIDELGFSAGQPLTKKLSATAIWPRPSAAAVAADAMNDLHFIVASLLVTSDE